MKAMVIHRIGELRENPDPLESRELPDPVPAGKEILVRVSVCGVCHTELDEIEGRTAPPRLPVIPGHQVVGRVAGRGENAVRFSEGDRVGIGWIHSTCGICGFCIAGNENLCRNFRATGRDADGGYGELMTVPEESAFAIPESFSDEEAAPLLCAGAVGYRSLRLCSPVPGGALGLTGFGASAHLVLKMVRHRYPDMKVYVFARNPRERQFSLDLGAVWAGGTEERSPEPLDCIIDTTPAWKPVVEALGNLAPGGRLVINAIGKEETDKKELQRLDYQRDLWLEKEIKSVANVTRADIGEFLALAGEMRIKPEVRRYALTEANTALRDLKGGAGKEGARVLMVR